MKVKSAELKANLSRYLKTVRETNESIEILIREEPVAYLTPIEQKSDTESTEEMEKLLCLKQALAKDGIILTPTTQPIGRKKTNLSQSLLQMAIQISIL
jgi:prevent-host-death family protein